MNRTDRLYALVEELRAVAPQPRSARQLAGRYEVSTRTIERDILALQESGVPIYAVNGRCGGYVIDQTRTLPPLNLTAAELVALAVSLAEVEGTPFAPALRSALRKVLAVAPAAQAAQAAELADRVRLIGSAAGRGSAPGPVPLAIQEAITARHVLRLRYRDRQDAVTSRDVEPVAFAGLRGRWYLVGWCRLRGAPRAFRTDRIVTVADTGQPAPQRSFGELEVDIPPALLRRVELAG